MPYFVPACAFTTSGTQTIAFPRNTASSACLHVRPAWIIPAVSMYEGMHTLIPTQRDARWRAVQVLFSGGVGARSAFVSVMDVGGG